VGQRIKKALSLIGPYPYNPYLLFLFFFAVQFCRLAIIIVDEPRGMERYSAAFSIALISLPPALFFALAGSLLNKFRPWSNTNVFSYILEVAFCQSFIFIYSPFLENFLQKRYSYKYHTLLNATPELFLGTLILALISLALMHRAERKILERLDTANVLVRQLKTDREELLNLDEDIRRQTSLFLHDRVQSDLMVVGMKLKSISGKSSAEVNEVIELAIARLENSRGEDLRNLIQTLSPNFDTAGLKGSLDVLVRQYESSTSISVEIDSETEKLDSQYSLGIYRIIEQALLNSLVHGPAKKVLVAVSTSAASVTEISVADDGPGADLATVQSGIGSAIIDSWVGILEGKKTVDTVPGHGYRLVVNFPDN
jgi:signal transduction histidine kinase